MCPAKTGELQHWGLPFRCTHDQDCKLCQVSACLRLCCPLAPSRCFLKPREKRQAGDGFPFYRGRNSSERATVSGQDQNQVWTSGHLQATHILTGTVLNGSQRDGTQTHTQGATIWVTEDLESPKDERVKSGLLQARKRQSGQGGSMQTHPLWGTSGPGRAAPV